MRVVLIGLLVCVASLVRPLPPLVADDLLQALPTEAVAVVRLASPDRYLGNVQNLLTSVGGPAVRLAPTQQTVLAQFLFERPLDLGLVDRSAPAYLVVFLVPPGTPATARLVTTADETALRRALLGAAEGQELAVEASANGFERVTALGRSLYFGRRAGMVVYTDREEVVKMLAAPPQSPLSAACPPAVQDLMAGGDVGLLIHAGQLVQTYARQFDQARAEVLRGISRIPPEVTGLPAEQAEEVRQGLATAANGVFDALADTRFVGVRLDLGAGGVTLAALATVAEGSSTAALLAANPPSGLDLLGLLPAGAPFYYAARPARGEWLTQLGNLLSKAYEQLQAASPEAQAALTQAEQLAAEAGLQSVAGSFAWPLNASSGVITSALSEADNPQALLAAAAKRAAAAGVVRMGSYSDRTEYQAAAETLDEQPVDLRINHFVPGTGQDEQTMLVKALMERIYGGPSLQTRLTVREGVLAEASGNDPRFLQQLVSGLASGEGLLGLDPNFAECRDALAPQANLVLMLNLPQMLVEAVRTFRDVPPFSVAVAQLPFNFNVQPGSSYAGLSLTAEQQALRIHLHVPAAQPRGLLQVFAPGQ
jgi:hypothetical protein